MKKKLLFFLMLFTVGALFAQTDTIKTLIISEVRFDRADHAYVELTNVGTETINLEEFEILSHHPWTTFPDDRRWPTEPHRLDGRWTMLPAGTLGPGESYIIATFHDDYEEKYAKDVAEWGYSQDYGGQWVTKPELKAMTDLPVHRAESWGPTDSISVYRELLESWGGRDVIMVRHHPPAADSCVIDQVGGLFSDEDGSNPDGGNIDVAGFSRATNYATLVRRYNVTEGNLTFVTGNDISESEWIPIPRLREGDDGFETWRSIFWTVGNHGDYNLDEATLTSSTIDINWTDHVLTVPWGVRHDDSIMYQFDRVPGLAWHYDYNSGPGASEDSLAISVRTGDTLTIYACGIDLDMIKWHIIAAPPTADANWVIPLKQRDDDGDIPINGTVFEVSHMVPGMDTISEIPFGTRTDSLLLYLEKAPNASWEFVWVDDNARTDLLNGDILKVTAESGAVKEYFLKVQEYRKARNADLSAITWPDIPEVYKGLYGWTGDTIPGFSPSKKDYKISVPYDVDGIPALVATNVDPNASHSIARATNLGGSIEERTVTITSVAENDTTIVTYTIVLEKQKSPADIQPWPCDPFISQYTWKADYRHTLMELMNPGPHPMDMSDYMIFCGWVNDPASAIGFGGGEDDWDNRYAKYIPGYKWQDPAVANEHSLAVQDVNINTNVFPGDVFVLAQIEDQGTDWDGYDNYPFADQIDVSFRFLEGDPDYTGNTCVYNWTGANIYIWKIVGDSIKEGWKPATDPEDFELVEVFGTGDGTQFLPIGPDYAGDNGQVMAWHRKPEVYVGNTDFNGSFGDTPADSEWTLVTEDTLNDRGFGWPDYRILLPDGTGSHFMNDVTHYKSTVSSTVYIVSKGFTDNESIEGLVDGTTVDEFYGNLIKSDPGQALECIAVADGAVLTGTDALLDGDTLVVTSVDMVNVTKYIVTVTAGGLSDDALLTSDLYTIDVTDDEGSVSGFDYGTTLKAIVDGVTVPYGASMTIIDANDEPVPLVILNFDTVYVDVQASDQIYLEVIAQNGSDKITYQLLPSSDPSDAFVTSDVYMIDQDLRIVNLVPQGITVAGFLSNLVPAPGATIQMFDKLGYERNEGLIYRDDIIVVTAEDGVTTSTYYITVLNMIATNLAFIESDDYTVDQSAFTITGVIATETVAEFMARISYSEGATVEVTDSDGTPRADGDVVSEGDKVTVVAADGVTTNTYVISTNTSINNKLGNAISIYPNPSDGIVNISGLEPGNRIRVYNSVGTAVKDVYVYSGVETISLEDQGSGMYFITINNEDGMIGQYKVIRK
jgi:Secretion system C-terminal sorting domain